MSKPKPAALQMGHNLDKIEGLLGLLQQEPWDEYDPVVTAACNVLVKQAYDSLQKTAKALAKVTPAETRSPGGEPWYEGILDRMQ